ncbi:hypothetical protein OJ965_05560 [Pantoea anthophila]|uniref:hypothetical protein n=1 Tax=Pantoea anthophila TaxID=470931 RepID=UPI0012B8E3B8|nr:MULTISPECIES: hypothetical protein [Pantoea]UZH03592.1 hypothetical protein OJ965_05560 [Pantoea anthophila]
MALSQYLKLKITADKKIADAFSKGLQGVGNAARENLSDIYSGTERLSWRTSCLTDKYRDVCSELNLEDKRMFLSVYEAYKRKDVFLDMFQLYTAYLLRDQDARKLENPDSPIQKKVMSIAGFAANGKASKVTKLAISYAMAKGMAEAAPISIAIRTAINGTSYIALSGLGFYGKVQKSAMAARRLHSTNPLFYQALYKNNLEMLYIYIEKVINTFNMKLSGRTSPTEQDIIRLLDGIK